MTLFQGFTFRPLIWLGKRTPEEERRSKWTFKASWDDTLRLLERELVLLGADRAHLFADFKESDITRAGLPKGNARQPDFPGIKIQFDSIHGELTYETDVCDLWQHNVRSLALGLKSLRDVDRYGLQQGRQYQGFLAIEGPRPMGSVAPPRFANAEEAKAFLTSQEVAGIAGADALSMRLLWHHLVNLYHPDKHGESDMWGEILDAKRVVEKAGLF